MSEYLILVECDVCGCGEYFEIDNLPSGRENCPYCAECGSLLPAPPNCDMATGHINE